MKKTIFALITVLMSVILSTLVNVAWTTYEVVPAFEEKVETTVDNAIMDYDHPLFTNQATAMMFFEKEVDRAATDSILRSIPRDVLEQIIHVVNGREHVFDTKDIITEYLRHYGTVYQYLRPEDVPTAAPTEIQIDDTTRATIRSDNDRDTVINGILYRIVHE